MNKTRSSNLWLELSATALLALALAACGGSGGSSAPPPEASLPTVIDTGATALAASSSLDIHINSLTIAHQPVVDFTVTNQAGAGMTGLTESDLRFNIAKLIPLSNGEPSVWQNYINRAKDGVTQGSQERVATGYAFGTLTRLGSGHYQYTFATDITDPVANPCPASCTDANGKALDIRYDAALTHRVTIQQANSAYPLASGVLDVVPAGGAPTQREIVATATCNTCHAQLKAHGTRVDTQLCVTCHNPGSSVAGTPATSVDFKALVHRIHFNNGGAALPSVQAGVPYKIGSTDFSSVTFPQDVRNCTRCHDGTPTNPNVTATPQGDHWKTQPSKEACGSCHDDVYFGSAPDPTRPYQTKAHSGGVIADNSACVLCHGAGKFADAKDIVIAHDKPARLKAAAARFSFNILSIGSVAAGSKPVITFSVTDPTRSDAAYDIKADPAFTAGGASSLSLKIGWTTAEFGNDGSGQAFGQPITINALSAAATVGATAGTYTVTSPVALPAISGTLRVTMEGHPAGDVTTAGSFTDRLAVKTVFKDAAVTGSLVTRRSVVDVAKCNVCHDTLSLHGNNRTNEIGACVVCHNPNATDAARRPTTAGVLTGGVDGKLEESIDFKRMVHGIHAGQADKGGFRTKGLTVYGFGGSVNDFSDIVFPGSLKDCATCHVGNSYQITGNWAAPTANGILGSTISTGASTTDSADNLRISPTAAVCSSCHDSAVAKVHMQDATTGGTFSATEATLRASVVENCAFCHGDGRVFDVKTVHGVK